LEQSSADVAKTEHVTLRRCSYAGVIVTKMFGRHHDLVDHYKISISQMTMDLFLYTQNFPSSITDKTQALVNALLTRLLAF
jgi:hypothetical protein